MEVADGLLTEEKRIDIASSTEHDSIEAIENIGCPVLTIENVVWRDDKRHTASTDDAGVIDLVQLALSIVERRGDADPGTDGMTFEVSRQPAVFGIKVVIFVDHL